MTKKLVAIPEGNLMRIAAMKSVTTLSALKEKPGVDRKTLRAINIRLLCPNLNGGSAKSVRLGA
jgi:hypothetical protein